MSYPSAGGFVASVYMSTEVKDCYSTGLVTGPGASLGGFCAGNWGAITDCFWDDETSGMLTSDGGTGQDTIYMKDWGIFITASWDMVVKDNDRTWAMSLSCNDGYPCLVCATPSCSWPLPTVPPTNMPAMFPGAVYLTRKPKVLS